MVGTVGLASAHSQVIHVMLNVTTVSPTSGSVAGGQMLTIMGHGFAPTASTPLLHQQLTQFVHPLVLVAMRASSLFGT
jgi:hypothetical protein